MGEVYRARDTKLDRDALKVLPEAFTADPDRLARFEREAKVLASLTIASIGTIHGLEESEGVKALVLELVEGPTPAELIERRTTEAGSRKPDGWPAPGFLSRRPWASPVRARTRRRPATKHADASVDPGRPAGRHPHRGCDDAPWRELGDRTSRGCSSRAAATPAAPRPVTSSAACGIPLKSITRSGGKPISRSGANRSAVPAHTDSGRS